MLTPEHMNDDAACTQSKIGRDDIGGILSNTEIHFTLHRNLRAYAQ